MTIFVLKSGNISKRKLPPRQKIIRVSFSCTHVIEVFLRFIGVERVPLDSPPKTSCSD
ncbi:hypothetical protein amyaer_0822 [Microcystis aeruginosa NIES-2481]|nr:hypothetical protein amyaer_0822 [Microcystis aeruginosa NIES-2481]